MESYHCDDSVSPARVSGAKWKERLTGRDLIHERICAKLGITPKELSLAQVLEAATWKGGREIAKIRRQGGGRESLLSLCPYALDKRSVIPHKGIMVDGAAPIDIISDGTVF